MTEAFPAVQTDDDLKPEIPVTLKSVWIDVFADGTCKVGQRARVADGAVTGQDVDVIFVACSDDFVPPVGQTPMTAYLEDVPFTGARDIRWEDDAYTVQLIPLGKADEELSLIIGKKLAGQVSQKSFVYEAATEVGHVAHVAHQIVAQQAGANASQIATH